MMAIESKKENTICNSIVTNANIRLPPKRHLINMQKSTEEENMRVPVVTCHLNSFNLFQHFETHYKDKLWCRLRCLELFDEPEELTKHWEICHKDKQMTHTCLFCGMEYQFKKSLTNHLERCLECPPEMRPVYKCKHCKAVYKIREDYHFHFKQTNCPKFTNDDGTSDTDESELSNPGYVSESKNRIPDLLPPSVESHVILKEYPTISPKKPTYQCKFCKECFESKEVGIQHCLSTHLVLLKQMAAQDIFCNICDKRFKRKIYLCKHMFDHYKESVSWDNLVPRNLLEIAYSSNYCWICDCNLRGLQFSSHVRDRNNRIDHFFRFYFMHNFMFENKTVESSENEGQSSIDEKKELALDGKFTTSTMIKFYASRNEASFGCTYCLQLFDNRYEYWHHVKVHLKELNYVEDDILNRTGIAKTKPWDCNSCDESFTDQSEFLRHVATHTLLCFDKVFN